MIGFLFFIFGVVVTLGMCGMAAVSDVKGYRIPNIVPIIIAGAFVVSFSVTIITGQNEIVFQSISSHLLSAGLVFVLTSAMFAFKILGAGDSKFGTAVALWLGLPGLSAFLIYMAFMGGLVAAATLAMRKWKPFSAPAEGSWPAKAQAGASDVPYGIAIAVGAVAGFVFQGYASFSTWMAMFGAG